MNPSARHLYVVSYDICDPKRWRKVYRVLLGRGDHIQLSVFLCPLNPRELVEIQSRLDEAILHGVDQILFVNLGPPSGRARTAISALGRPFHISDARAVVV